MIAIEFFLSLYLVLTLGISLILVMKKILASPIFEDDLLFLTAFIVFLAIVMANVIALISDKTELHGSVNSIARVAWSCLGLFYIFLTFAFMLPNFKIDYLDIFQLSIVVGINASLSVVTYYTVKVTITDSGYLRNEFSISSAILFFASTGIFFYFVFRRFRDIKTHTEASETEFISLTTMISIVIIAFITLTIILVTFRLSGVENVFELDIPGYSFMIPFSFIFTITAYYIYQDQSYPFIIPVNLFGIIIADRETGITIMTKDYQSEIHAIDLLGNLFTALDMTLQDTVKSSKTIEDIIFGDKVIHIASGSMISTITIVSKNSLITKSITKYITKEFEKRYKEDLKDIINTPLDRNTFVEFNTVFDEVRKYLAL
jgi:hypothetical protein